MVTRLVKVSRKNTGGCVTLESHDWTHRLDPPPTCKSLSIKISALYAWSNYHFGWLARLLSFPKNFWGELLHLINFINFLTTVYVFYF